MNKLNRKKRPLRSKARDQKPQKGRAIIQAREKDLISLINLTNKERITKKSLEFMKNQRRNQIELDVFIGQGARNQIALSFIQVKL